MARPDRSADASWGNIGPNAWAYFRLSKSLSWDISNGLGRTRDSDWMLVMGAKGAFGNESPIEPTDKAPDHRHRFKGGAHKIEQILNCKQRQNRNLHGQRLTPQHSIIRMLATELAISPGQFGLEKFCR